MAKKNLRADAAKAVFAVLENGQSLRECLTPLLEPHSDKDKAWIQEMVYGVLRHLPQLQVWLRQLLNKPLKSKQKVIEHLLLVGLYQLAFTRVSTHAAVAESVNACLSLKSPGLKGLVNAILRNFIRQKLDSEPSSDPVILSGLPGWLHKYLDHAYDESTFAQVIEQSHQKAPLWLRVNTCQLSREAFCEQLKLADLDYTISPLHADGVILNSRRDVTLLPGFSDGWFSVQDGAAQLAADYLPVKTNQRVLDACAAPGGKTTHILQRHNNKVNCIALDIEASRMVRTKENLSRLQFQAEVVIGDASEPEQWWDGIPFDCILLDAPCSATGVIRRHPDIKWLRKKNDIDVLVSLQAKIMDRLWKTLAPGGTLLYATCSILPQENKQQIEAFLQRTPDATAQPLAGENGPCMQQILPGEEQMDGFFYAKLHKSLPTDGH